MAADAGITRVNVSNNTPTIPRIFFIVFMIIYSICIIVCKSLFQLIYLKVK